MKIVMPHGSGPDWDGHIVGWAPGGLVEVPDGNEKAVAWARGWLEHGATLVEDVAKPKHEPAKTEPRKPTDSSR